MADFKPNITRTLSLSGGSEVAHATVTRISCKANQGWSWSAVVNSDSGPDPYQSLFTPYKIDWTDGLGNSRTSPDLCWITPRDFTDGSSTSGPSVLEMGGVDLTGTKMRTNNQSFASFSASSSGAIMAALASRIGITLDGYSGRSELDFYVIEEDVKNAKLIDALNRILNVCAGEYFVRPDNRLSVRLWEDSGLSLDFDYSSLKHVPDPSRLFTGLRLGKRSSARYDTEQVFTFNSSGYVTQSLSPSLNLPFATNESISGAGNIAAVTFYNASDQWVEHQDFTLGSRPAPGGVQGTGTCTYLIAEVVPPTVGSTIRAKIRVNGTAPGSLPAGVSPEFVYPPMATSLGSWPAEGDFVDQLFPGYAWAEARYPQIKNKLNGPADRLIMEGPLQANNTVDLFSRFTYRTRAYKVDSIVWDFMSKRTSLELVRVVSEV